MRIAIDIRLLGKGGPSGISEYTTCLIDALLDLNSSHEFVFFYNGFRKKPFPTAWQRPNVSAIETRIPNRLLDLTTRFFNWPKLESFAGFDLVFSPHFNAITTDKPHVITFHDLSFVHRPDFFTLKQKFWHWLQHYQRQARRAKAIIAISRWTKNDLQHELHIPGKKINVIYSGIRTEFKPLDPHDQALRTFLKIHSLSKPYILYLGALEKRKNIEAVIAGFSEFKKNTAFQDYELILAGAPGYGAHKLLRHIQLRSDIRIVSGLTNAERVFLYNGARSFIYLSFFEGFGFPPLEAQACGIPVIAARRTALTELLTESALLVDPWKTADIAAALTLVEQNSSERQTLIQNGLTNAARFDWKKTAQSTLSLLESIRAQPRPTGESRREHRE